MKQDENEYLLNHSLLIIRGAPEPIFKVPAGTGSGQNWKKVPAGTDLLSHMLLCLLPDWQTLKSLRRELAKVRGGPLEIPGGGGYNIFAARFFFL
jgi:hypothetical protein